MIISIGMAKILPKLVVIAGPTASGKSALGIQLAKKFNGEVISADSRQIYREMDIGTAKPPRDKTNNRQPTAYYSEGILHHLIDIRNPDQDYTVADFKRDALRTINAIVKKKKLPILVGGTGLYIKAVTDNLDIPRAKPNPSLRAKLEKELRDKGLASLFKKLVALDPEAAYIVDPRNPRRVIRALEIINQTQKLFSAQRKKGIPLFTILKLGINPPPETLRKRLERRVDRMIADGLVKEVKKVIAKYTAAPPSFDAIGYREIVDFLRGKISEPEAIRQIKTNTWRFAKRQMTWFKADHDIHWIPASTEKGIEKLTRQFLFSSRK